MAIPAIQPYQMPTASDMPQTKYHGCLIRIGLSC